MMQLIFFFKNDYNISICDGVIYMKVNNLWITDNDLVEQKLINMR